MEVGGDIFEGDIPPLIRPAGIEGVLNMNPADFSRLDLSMIDECLNRLAQFYHYTKAEEARYEIRAKAMWQDLNLRLSVECMKIKSRSSAEERQGLVLSENPELRQAYEAYLDLEGKRLFLEHYNEGLKERVNSLKKAHDSKLEELKVSYRLRDVGE